MEVKPYSASIRMDHGLVSFQVPDDHSDNESDYEQDENQRQEICQEMQDLLQNINDTDDDDSSHSHEDEATSLAGEMTFNREINEKNAQLKNATSTPFASHHRRHETLLPQSTLSESSELNRRGRGDLNENRNHFLGKLDVVPEYEPTLRSAGDRPGQENQYGFSHTRTTPMSLSYERLKDLEKSSTQPVTMSNGKKSPSDSRTNGSTFRSPIDVGHLLKQETLYPSPGKDQINLIVEAKDRKIEQLRSEMDNNCQALEGELRSFQKHVEELSEDNQALQHERDKDQVELSALRDQVGELRSFLKENRINLDAMKEEKQDLLRKLYINEGTVVQLRTELEKSTSWETVDNLKTQNEAMILQLKNVHESELRKLYEQNRRENNCLESQTRQLKEDLESVKEKLHASEAAKTLLQESLTALQKENASNATSYSERRQDQQALELLQLQLKTKSEEVARMTRRIEELEGKLTDLQKSSSGESSQLRGELSDAVQENIKLLDEQTKAVKESIKIRDDLVRFTNENILLKNEMSRLTNENTGLTIADQNKTAEIQILRRELVDLKKEMDSLEKARNDLQENVLFLQKDLAAKKVTLAAATSRRSLDLLQRQIVRKEEEMATAAKKFREVEDNLYNQLKNAAAENLQLRDDKTKLQTDIHLMKKVLKKLKKHITGNPSPSGDSGISTENKIDASRSAVTVAEGEDALPDRTCLRELITIKDMQLEMERKYQQQLDIDRQKIIAQIDAIYTHKLQQVLAKMKSNPTGSHHHLVQVETSSRDFQ